MERTISDKVNGDIKSFNDNLTNVVLESALEVGEKATKENRGKLSTTTKDLIRKRCIIVIKTRRDKVEVAELSKTFNKRKTNDTRNYNMKKIEETLKKGNKYEA